MDCIEDFETSKMILEMVSPALDNNPRRIKQFINQFRFQRTIGKRTGLFCYDEDTNFENMWNCRKLAKFVAININWNSLISALNSNKALLTLLQEYALNSENEDKNLEKWTRDERLIRLLRYGCIEEDNLSQTVDDYTLSGLDFSKLLQISPIVLYLEDENVLSPLPEAIGFMGFFLIPEGEFMMGSPQDELGRSSEEGPVHKVTIKNSFYLSKYPVTQKHWKKVMGNNPSSFKGDYLPVENVSWDDVQEFLKKLNETESVHKYRLPSEAEWEYACRAKTISRYSFGDDESMLRDYAWYRGQSEGKTHPVAQKKPNSWGLYDMHGDVWEWVQDKWHDNYNGSPSDGSAWEDGDSPKRVIRGGGWHNNASYCRSANRSGDIQSNRDADIGFRLLMEL